MKRSSPIYYFFNCILLTLLSNSSFSQNNFTYRWYSSDNNELPQSSVKTIVSDKYDFIWLSTENGLVRYDGYQFLTFNSANTKLKGSRFGDILGNVKKDSLYAFNEDKKELILIHNRRIQIINNKKVKHNSEKNGKVFFPHGGLPSLKTVGFKDQLYVELSNNNTYYLNTTAIELRDSKMKRIFKIPYTNKSVLNFFTLDDTLYYLKENGDYDFISNNKIYSGKLNSILKENFKIYWNTTANQVFLYAKNKIYRLTAQNKRLSAECIAEFKDFDYSNIISVFHDPKNLKLFLGSSTNGLCIITFSSFKSVKKNPLKAELYYSSLPFTKNTIITNEGLILNSTKIIDSIPFISGKYFNAKTTMTKDASGGIWIVHKKNLYRYSKESNYKKYKQYTFDQEIKVIYTDLDNTIWVSLRREEGNKAKLYVIANEDNQKPKLLLSLNVNINYIAQNEHKTVYLGTDKGLYQYDCRTYLLDLIKNTAQLNVRSIFIDRDKKIWITTYEQGFFLSENNTLHTFPKDQNKYLNSSHCIVEDKKGFFWISTNKGLFQASKKSLLQYTQDKTTTIYYHFYNKTNGFLTNEFNGGCQPCGNYLENDSITFPSINGMVFFNPNTIEPILPDKTLFIDEVIIDHKSTYFKDTIVLQNNFERVTFFIDSPYYGNPYNLNLEARLNGVNKSLWEKISANKRISYTALPPGEYTLVIRHLPGFNSKYHYKKITLIVLAAFYQTLWFKALMYFTGLAIIFYLSRIRFLYIKNKNKELEQIIVARTQKLATVITALEISKTNLTQEILQQKRLIETISHDIKSPLKYLVLTVHHLYKDLDKMNSISLQEQAKSAYKSSFQLYVYVENLVKYSKIFIEDKKLEENSYSLYDLVAIEIQLFEKMALSENTIIINSVNRTESLKTNKKIVSIIIHNLFDNALKNTTNGTIELRSETKGKKLSFSIKDNGIGMDEELIDYYTTLYEKQTLQKEISRNYGQGLPMIIELLGIIEGEIKITSPPDSGTSIEIIIDTI